MKEIRNTFKKTGRLHHAYGISGDREKVQEEIFAFLEHDLNFPINANPDFWQGEFNVFKVDDGRTINEAHLNMPIKYDRKVFVIFANSMTDPAQNSLLKIFEEPQASTTFFLVLPSMVDLLPTLKSRLIFGTTEDKKKDSLSLAEEFLNAKVGKRLEIVAKIVKDIKDEKQTKAGAIKFIKNIELVVKNNMKVKNAHNARSGSLLAIEDLEKAISYASDESPSIKVILEHLALVL